MIFNFKNEKQVTLQNTLNGNIIICGETLAKHKLRGGDSNHYKLVESDKQFEKEIKKVILEQNPLNLILGVTVEEGCDIYVNDNKFDSNNNNTNSRMVINNDDSIMCTGSIVSNKLSESLSEDISTENIHKKKMSGLEIYRAKKKAEKISKNNQE